MHAFTTSARWATYRKRANSRLRNATIPILEQLEERRLLAGLVDYVIQISVDGLRPDAIGITNDSLTNFHRLRTESAWTDNARCDYNVSETLPNHVGVITGRPLVAGTDAGGTAYEGHTWSGNDTVPSDHTIHSEHTPSAHYIESVFDTAHDYNLRTSLIAGKTKFALFDESYDDEAAQYQGGLPDTVTPPDNTRDKIDYYNPQELDWWNSQTGAPNTSWNLLENDAKTGWLDIMRGENDDKDPFQYSFLHFRDPDKAGHYDDPNGSVTDGWGAGSQYTAYNHALQHVDDYLGAIFDLIDNTPQYAGRTAIVLTADHGGGATGATNHNDIDAAVVYTIPFYVWGPGIAQNGDPTSGDHGELYNRNTNTRTNPSTNYVNNTALKQPIRNNDASNVALDLLGLPAITHSYFNKLQNLDFGTLKLTGTESADTISVVVDTGDSSSWEVTGAVGGTQHYTIANYASIRIDALGGDDSVTVSADVTVPCVINGGDGNDNLRAGSGDDHIDAGADNDTLTGMDGNDTLDGGSGNDTIEGGLGNDSLIGGAGNDTYVFAGTGLGTDHVVEDPDADTDTLDFTSFGQYVNVFLGRTTLPAVDASPNLVLYLSDESSIENVKGSNNSIGDSFHGNSRPNVFWGNNGGDTLYAGDATEISPDTFYGGAGIDTADYSERLNAAVNVSIDNQPNDGAPGEGDNIRTDVENLIGTDGNDTLAGSSAPNKIWGGRGNDTIYGMQGADSIYGQQGDDLLYGYDASGGLWDSYGGDWIEGNVGADSLYGSNRRDTIWGDNADGSGWGADTIYGLWGNDAIHGGPDNDLVYGGYGDDYICGDEGDDTLWGNDPAVPGAMGSDTLYGGLGADNLHGGGGSDRLYGGLSGAGPGDGSADLLDGGDGLDYGGQVDDGLDILVSIEVRV